ncbi:hypothetical protein AVEN_165462-1 [Araneus ventricosus]|uniref:Uncharacterized protein n=1 Tax=Araneus ventricosus TaxID=182803 RepID=A0A4Y2HVK9_ARAVE|nr:hypothetical protein AVEN_165462-1 [Araneus ventricosus]
MSAILKNRGIPNDDKAKLCMQILQKILNILDHNKVVQETIPEPVSDQNTEEEKKDVIENLILESALQNLKSNNRNILNYLKNSQDEKHWTSDGELIFKGHNVKNSNVLDLIKPLQTPFNKPHPQGFGMFLQGLSEMNFPKSFIKNTSLKFEKKEEEEPPKRRKRDVVKPKEWFSLEHTQRKKKINIIVLHFAFEISQVDKLFATSSPNLTYIPNFYSQEENNEMFTKLSKCPFIQPIIKVWGKSYQPLRKSCSYGDMDIEYEQSGHCELPLPWKRTMLKIKSDVKKIGFEYNFVLLNFYEGGPTKIGAQNTMNLL